MKPAATPRWTEPAVRAALAEAHSHTHGKQVAEGTDPVQRFSKPTGAVPLDRVLGGTPLGRSVANVLQVALAPQRWEPWNRYNDHRAYPSSRSAFLVDVVVIRSAGRWIFDPVRCHLVPEAGADGHRTPAEVDQFRVELVVRPERLAPRYGSLRDALGLLEAGHVATALSDAATRAGLATTVEAPDAQPDSGRDPVLVLDFRPASPGLSADGHPGLRTSGFGPRGLSADARLLPAAAVHGLCAPELMVLPDWAPPLRILAERIEHWLVLRGVDGMPDGAYTLRAEGLERSPRRTAQMDAVLSAFTYPADQVDVGSMNVAWTMVADVAGIVRADGPAAYRRLLLMAGALAQRVCTRAGAANLFCRPCRSVIEPVLEAALDLPPTADFLYLLLAGRPRLVDLAYPLDALEVRR